MNTDYYMNKMEDLKKMGTMSFLEGATVDQIDEFEKKNGVELPIKFKEWLQVCDGGELFLPAGIQLYGVAHKPIINVNEEDRPNNNYIVIGALSSGDPILYEKGYERISIYNHEAGRIEGDEVYEDFCAFLNGLYDLLGLGE